MVKLQDNLDGTYTMMFKPTFNGNYQVTVRIDDVHVPGSPFTTYVKN